MDGVKPSRKQKIYRNLFKEAVAYAKKIIYNRELKKKYLEKVQPGQTVYHYAVREYMKEHK